MASLHLVYPRISALVQGDTGWMETGDKKWVEETASLGLGGDLAWEVEVESYPGNKSRR